MRIDVMSVKYDNVTMGEALDLAMEHISEGSKCRVVTPNSEIGLAARGDDRLRELINRSELVLPDGIGVIYAARILGTPLKGKVAGVEFAAGLAQRLSQTGKTLYILGGKPGVAMRAADNLQKTYPGLTVAGYGDGYFKDEGAAVSAINASGADVLFVCMGSPRQELFMDNNRDKLNVSLMAGLGGSVDIFAGDLKRAPDIFVRTGFEWLYRLLKEPSRIGRMAKLPLYLIYALAERRKGDNNHA